MKEEDIQKVDKDHEYYKYAQQWLGKSITLECVHCRGTHVMAIRFPLVIRCTCDVVTLYFYHAVNHLRTWPLTMDAYSPTLRPGWSPVREASTYFSRCLTKYYPGEDQVVTTSEGRIDVATLPLSVPVNVQHESMKRCRR